MDRGTRRVVVPFLIVSRVQQTLDCLVLRTHDVGEADRLCIMLTKERGRLAMRARAVRKLGSRMGALLLPGRRLIVDMREDGSYATVVAARLNGDVVDLSHPSTFAVAQQGIELLLLLTEDGDPLPDVFDALFQFLHACGAGASRALLPFQLRVMHVLGLLPSHALDRRFAALEESDRSAVRLCGTTGDFSVLCAGVEDTEGLRRFVADLLDSHAGRTLKSDAVFAALAA